MLFENLFKPCQLYLQPQSGCFEQPTACFLVCSLIFIEYYSTDFKASNISIFLR